MSIVTSENMRKNMAAPRTIYQKKYEVKPRHFPLGNDKFRWTRTYPRSMKLDPSDHLAVASGVYERYMAWLDSDDDKVCPVNKNEKGCYVEDISGLHFDETDVAYLDYCMTTKGAVPSWIAQYREEEGAERFSMGIVTSIRHIPGWMYWNLGTYLWYQNQRDKYSIDGDPSFMSDDIPSDDGWTNGRSWGNERLDWEPQPGQIQRIMEDIRSRRVEPRYTKIPGGYSEDNPLKVKWKWRSSMEINTPDGDTAFTFPGQYSVSTQWNVEEPTDMSPRLWHPQTVFTDRYLWESILYASEGLRDLLSRVIEGPGRVDENNPKEKVLERLNELWWAMPDKEYLKETAALEMCRACESIKDMILARMKDWEYEKVEQPPVEDWLYRLFSILATPEGKKRRKKTRVHVMKECGFRTLDSFGTYMLEYASCFTVKR